MSLIKAIKAQLGISSTPANNFTLDASAADGTMKLARNSGQDIITVSAAGAVSLLGGVVAPGTGMIGEYLQGTDLGSQSIVTTSFYGAASLTIPAGVWDVFGECSFSLDTGPSTVRQVSINTVNSAHGAGLRTHSSTMTAGFPDTLSTGLVRLVLASPTLYYVVGRAAFSGGTMNIVTGQIYARRVA